LIRINPNNAQRALLKMHIAFFRIECYGTKHEQFHTRLVPPTRRRSAARVRQGSGGENRKALGSRQLHQLYIAIGPPAGGRITTVNFINFTPGKFASRGLDRAGRARSDGNHEFPEL
jgi:hypothetical protein